MAFFLGIDPGIRKLGYALIDENKKIIECGALINELKAGDKDNGRRLLEIDMFFDKILERYDIKSVCMEKLFFSHLNQANAEYIYGVRGILLAKFFKKGIKVINLSPKEIKKFTTGNGNATKIVMQKAIKRIFRLVELPQPHDVADALAMAMISSLKR